MHVQLHKNCSSVRIHCCYICKNLLCRAHSNQLRWCSLQSRRLESVFGFGITSTYIYAYTRTDGVQLFCYYPIMCCDDYVDIHIICFLSVVPRERERERGSEGVSEC